MKKLIVGTVMAFSALSASAQTKIGYINTDVLISLMPEAAKVDSQLREYQQSLQLQGQALQIDADKKRDEYFKDSATLSASMKEIRRDELVKLFTRLQNYDQEPRKRPAGMPRIRLALFVIKRWKRSRMLQKRKAIHMYWMNPPIHCWLHLRAMTCWLRLRQNLV